MTSKQRIPPLPREAWTDEAREVFGYWEGPEAYRNGSRSHVMMAIAHHPPLAKQTREMGRYMLTRSLLDERTKELIVLRVAWRFDCDHQWVHHTIAARRAGFSDEEIEALATEEAETITASFDRAVIAATDQLVSTGKIASETWELLAEQLDHPRMLDLIYAIGFFAMNAWAMGAMQLAPEMDTSYSKPLSDL